jgi:hypothetical protein
MPAAPTLFLNSISSDVMIQAECSTRVSTRHRSQHTVGASRLCQLPTLLTDTQVEYLLKGCGVTRREHARFRANDRLIGQPPQSSTISWIRPVILAHWQAALWQAALWQAARNPDYTHSSPLPLSHCVVSFCTVNSKAPDQVRNHAFLLLLQRSHRYARWTSFKASQFQGTSLSLAGMLRPRSSIKGCRRYILQA